MKSDKLCSGLLSCLLALIISLSVFVGCRKEEEPPDYSDLLTLDNMDDNEKFEYLCQLTSEHFDTGIEQSMDMSANVTGKFTGIEMEIDVHVTIDQITVGNNTADFADCTINEQSIKATILNSGREENESYKTTKGFVDGQMYYSYVPNGDDSEGVFYRSPCTAEEYIALSNGDDEDEENEDESANFLEQFVDLCEKHSARLNKKKAEWTFNISQIKEGASIEDNSYLNDIMSSFPLELTANNINLTCVFDARSGVVKSLSLEMELNSTPESDSFMNASINIKGNFSVPQEIADLTPEYFDTYSTDVDLLQREIALNAIDELIYSDNKSLSMLIACYIEGSSQDYVTGYTEQDDINYGVVNDKFRFSDKAIIDYSDGSTLKLKATYDGSKYLFYQNGELQAKSSISESDARDKLISIFGFLDISEQDITGLGRIDSNDNLYHIDMHFGMNEFAQTTLSNFGLSPEDVISFTHQLSLTFDEDMNLTSAYYLLRTNFQGYFMEAVITISDIGEADFSLLN